MKLSIPIILNILLVLGFYSADKHTKFKQLPQTAKQIIIGMMFGGVSAFASSVGVEWLGTIVNVRDAAPLSAGLIFDLSEVCTVGFLYTGAAANIPNSRVQQLPSSQASWQRD